MHCNNSVQTLGTGSNSKSFGFNDCCSGQAPIHKFHDPFVPETELWRSAIQLSDDGLDLCEVKTVCVFSIIEQRCSRLVSICDLG